MSTDPYKITTPWALIRRWMRRYYVTRCVWALFDFFFNPVFTALNKRCSKGTLGFLKAFLINPRSTGAILPSSRYLAREMAAHVSSHGLVVELGPGTGVFTAAMLRAGVAAERIIAIEYAPHLAQKLKLRFPNIRVIEGNAAYLTTLLKDTPQPITTIISGLPLRSLPKEVTAIILEQIPQTLAPEGRYIQFTYDIRKNKNYYPANYKLTHSKIIWRNVPSAKVDVFLFS